MKLASAGIDPTHVEFTADHVLIHDSTELLNVSFHWLFYYLILETPGFFFTVQHRKWNRHRYRTPLHRIYGHTVRGGGGDFKSIFGSEIGGEWTRSWFCWIYCCPRFRWAIRFNSKRSRISNNGWTKFRLKRPTESRFLKSSSVKTRLLQDHYDCSFLHDTSTNRYNFSVPVRQI